MNKRTFLETDLLLEQPFNMIISGGTMTGKSFLIERMLKNQSKLFRHPFQKIIYAYGAYDELYLQLSQEIIGLDLYEGLPYDPLKNPLKHFKSTEFNLVVLDDLGVESMNSPLVEKLFTIYCHHYNISVILVVHNLYGYGNIGRTINRNTQYMILTASKRDKSAVLTLGRQLFPDKRNFLISAYTQAMQMGRYSHLLVDLRPHCIEQLQIRQNILPLTNEEVQYVYIPE